MHTFSPSSMDSTTSGSIQSSSTAGDQELDSRSQPQPISSFLNPPHPSPIPHHHLHNLPSSLLHPLPNYLCSLQCPPPSNLNLMGFDTTWSTALCPSSSSPNPNLIDLSVPITSSPPDPSTVQPPTTPADLQARNSKKRPRASRRAPTTVLTTDTSNFRAIVQEFTGIPALPLSTSSCTRPRYDLFYATAPRHLLRPLAPSSSSSLMADAMASTTRTSMQRPFTFQSLLQSQTTPTMPDLGARPQGPSSYVARDIRCSPLRATVGICGESSRVRSNCPAPAPPDNGSEKGSESVPPSRSEGGMDSWILSSD